MTAKKQRVNLTLDPQLIGKIKTHYPGVPLATAATLILELHFPQEEKPQETR